MVTNASAPLLALLDSDFQRNASWQEPVSVACTDSIEHIDGLLETLERVDRDVKVCLEAVRNSLDWAAHEASTADEVHATLVRALEIFHSVAETI